MPGKEPAAGFLLTCRTGITVYQYRLPLEEILPGLIPKLGYALPTLGDPHDGSFAVAAGDVNQALVNRGNATRSPMSGVPLRVIVGLPLELAVEGVGPEVPPVPSKPVT